MTDKLPREKDIIKFKKDGKLFAGEVIHVTDYDTVNIVPYNLSSVWSIAIDRVESILERDTSKVTLQDLEDFMEGVSMMVRVSDNTISIVSKPPRLTLH